MGITLTPFQKLAVHVGLRSVHPDNARQLVRDYLRTYPGDSAKLIEVVREVADELGAA